MSEEKKEDKKEDIKEDIREDEEEDEKEEKKEVNESMNKSMRTNMMCNHCLYVSKTYEEMKEHYKSEFHKYNLNRVTMNLAPLSFEEYKRKKEFFMKKMEEKKKNEEKKKLQSANLYCDICNKKFNSRKKLDEHLTSKTHLKNKSKKEENKKEDEKEENKDKNTAKEDEKKNLEPEKTTLDDISICLFCNIKNENLKENMYHMVQEHKLDIPFVLYIKNYPELIKLLAKKIFTYHACLYCDTQKFETIRSLQKHMLAKGHLQINDKDLDEFIFKYYDLKKLLSIKDKNKRRSKEFKILSLRARVAKELKEKNLEGNDEWEEVKSDEEDEDYEPMTLPNGELLLQDGTTLGNKEYKVYYKQKFHINKYEELQKAHKMRNKERNLRLKRRDQVRKNIKRNINYRVLKGSNKANYVRINKLTVMRPQIALV